MWIFPSVSHPGVLGGEKEPQEMKAGGEGGSRPETSAGPLHFPDGRGLTFPQVVGTRQVRAFCRLGAGQVASSWGPVWDDLGMTLESFNPVSIHS